MTETTSDARTGTAAGKRRPRPKTRRRPQSRNPSAPMSTPDPAPTPGAEKAPGSADAGRSGASSGRGSTAAADEPGEAGASGVRQAGPGSAEGGREASGRASASADAASEAAGHGGSPADPGEAGRGSGGVPPVSGRGGSGEKSRRPRTARRKKPAPRPAPGTGSAENAEAPAERGKAARPAGDTAQPAAAEEPEPSAADGTAKLAKAAATAKAHSAAALRWPRRALRAMPRPAPRTPRAKGEPRRATRVLRVLARGARRLNPRRLPLRRIPHWWPAALLVLTGVLAGLAYGLLRPAQYTATSYVAVVPGDEGDPMTALGFAQAYGRIATDTAVLARAQQESGVPVETLKGNVEAVTSPDAPMIEITGHAPRAAEAADVANAVARSLTEVADDSAADTGVELTAFSRARAPREPSTPSPVLTTAVGGSAGVLLGALVLLVRPRRESAAEEAARSSTVPAPVGGEPADRGPRQPDAVREKEAVR